MNFKLQTRSAAECPTPHAFQSCRYGSDHDLKKNLVRGCVVRQAHHDKWFQGGFTLIELLIVITILGVLTGVALLDYGFSVKKARIQIAAEEMVALLGDASVRAQTQFSQTDSEGDGTETIVVCYGVTIEKGMSPVLFKTVRDEETELCSMSNPSAWESIKELSWDDLVFVTSIDWVSASSPTEGDEGSADWIAFLFSPPEGTISVYLDSDSPVQEPGVTEVQVRVAYQNSTEPVLNKVVKINPVTSSFMILTQSEREEE